MFKIGSFIFGLTVLSLPCAAAPKAIDCQTSSSFEANLRELKKVGDKVRNPNGCSTRTSAAMIKEVCLTVALSTPAKKSTPDINFRFQEVLYEMSCLDPAKVKFAQAKAAIQKLWLQYREQFNCSGYLASAADGKNVIKLGMEVRNTDFVETLLIDYEVDVNFKDKGDHGHTVLDYLLEREAYYKQQSPPNIDRLRELSEMHEVLIKNKAKLSKDL